MNTAEKLAHDFLTRVWGPEHDIDVFASPSGDRVVWRVRDGRLAECWVEREPPRYRPG